MELTRSHGQQVHPQYKVNIIILYKPGISQVNINHITGREKRVAYNNNDVIVAWSHLVS